MYNVGPDFARPAASSRGHKCPSCGSAAVEWDGAEGEHRCADCFEPLPDYCERA
jgi:hypothetical protein